MQTEKDKKDKVFVEYLLENHQISELQDLLADSKYDYLVQNCWNPSTEYIKIRVETYPK